MRKFTRKKIYRKRKTLRGGGIFDFLFKGANTFIADPLEVNRKGRNADLLDFLVNLKAKKGEWRRLKRNLAKLAVYDLEIPPNKLADVDNIIQRLEQRGIKLNPDVVN